MTFTGTEFSVTGLQGTDVVTSVTLTSSGAAATAPVSGSPYSITPSAALGTGLANYTISYVDGALRVTPATLTITATDQTKAYGTTFSFTGTEFTTSGLAPGDTVASVTLTSAGAAITAPVSGSPYAIIPSAAVGTGVANYTITYVDGALTVTAASLTITASDQTKASGATFTFAGTEFSSTGLVNGDTVDSATITSAGAPAAAAPGTYPIDISAPVGSGLANYTITYVPGTMTVGNTPPTVGNAAVSTNATNAVSGPWP